MKLRYWLMLLALTGGGHIYQAAHGALINGWTIMLVYVAMAFVGDLTSERRRVA